MPPVNLMGVANGHDNDNEKHPPEFWISPRDTKVIIEQGELICGIVDKRTVGNQQGSLIHIIWNEKGPEKTRRFLDETQQIVNYWLLNHGFSVGIGDTIADEATMGEINKTISQAKKKVKDLIKASKDKLPAKFEGKI